MSTGDPKSPERSAVVNREANGRGYTNHVYRDKAQRDVARSLRNQPTSPEKRLWHFVRAEQLRNHKFRRQARAPCVADGRGPYIVDFVCFAVKLIVELDGPQHLEPDAGRSLTPFRFPPTCGEG